MNSYQIVRENDVIEHVSWGFNQSQCEKKYCDDLIELCFNHIPAYEGLAIAPVERDDVAKTFFIIEGECLYLETNEILKAGDSLVVRNTDNYIILYALKDTKLFANSVNCKAYTQHQKAGMHIARVLGRIQDKDAYTDAHCSRVRILVQKMALRLNYSGNRMVNLLIASRYHDLGKIYIEDTILNKAGKLTLDEYEIMKTHVLRGRNLLDTRLSGQIFGIILQHHERNDGSGYPYGLTDKEICEEAKILAICDSYDAMTVDRVYKRKKGKDESLAELRSMGGTKYDSGLVEVFCEVLDLSFEEIYQLRLAGLTKVETDVLINSNTR